MVTLLLGLVWTPEEPRQRDLIRSTHEHTNLRTIILRELYFEYALHEHRLYAIEFV
jgi:hypothetical protein